MSYHKKLPGLIAWQFGFEAGYKPRNGWQKFVRLLFKLYQ